MRRFSYVLVGLLFVMGLGSTLASAAGVNEGGFGFLGGGGLSSASGWTLNGTAQTVTADKAMALAGGPDGLCIADVCFDGDGDDGISIGATGSDGNMLRVDNTLQDVMGPPVRIVDARSGNTLSTISVKNSDLTDGNISNVTWTSDTTGGGATADTVFARIGTNFATHSHAARAGVVEIVTLTSAGLTKVLTIGATAVANTLLVVGGVTATSFTGPSLTSAAALVIASAAAQDIGINPGTSGAVTVGGTNPRILSATGMILSAAGAAANLTLSQTSGNGSAVVSSVGSNSTNGAFIYGGANDVGETGTTSGTGAALAGATLATSLHRMASGLTGSRVNVFDFQGNGHLVITGTAAADFVDGNCTTDTGAGDDHHGVISAASCTAGQTMVVDFITDYTATPTCFVNATTTESAVALFFITPAVGSLTVTTVGVNTAPAYTYTCKQ